MAVSKMKRMSLVGLLRDKEDIIGRLQELGTIHISGYDEICQMKEAAEELEQLQASNLDGLSLDNPEEALRSNKEYQTITEEREKLKRCIEELAPFDERKKGLFSFLRPVKAEDLADAGSRRASIIAEAERIIATDANVREKEESAARIETRLKSIDVWRQYPYVLSDVTSQFTTTDFLSAESLKEIDELKSALSEAVPSADFWVLDRSESVYPFVMTCLRDEHPAAEKVFTTHRITRYDFSDIDSAPETFYNEQKALLESELGAKNELLESRKTAASHISDFELLYDYLGIKAEKIKADISMSDSTVTFRLEGWVPARNESAVKEELSDEFICHMEFSEPADNELPPTKLENGFIGSAVEPVESMYSMLKYGELDPSAISSIFYALFFGFMFSDAGYGIILTLACLIILIKCKLRAGMKKNITLFLFSGISTTFWGIVFGSWFGNLVQTVSLGKFAIKPLWFDPQDSANTEHFLAFTLLLGVIHLYAAYGMKAANLIRKGKWLDAICDVFFWYIFYTGEILFLLPYIPYYKNTQFCASYHKYGIYLLGIGFLLILFTKGRKSKNPFIKMFGGITCLYSLVDMLSDCLSYTRLMAMGLATSVIINVFNSIAASAAGLNTAGITFRFIVFIIIFIAANLFNFAINALGAYVNACRLTYIEFFGKFYEGDGTEYAPLTYNTEYVYIEEENSTKKKRR